MAKLRKLPKEEEQLLSTESLHDSASVAQTKSAPSFTSSGGRKVTLKDIEFVQNLIERCLVLYMTRDEVISMLANRAKLEPHFISLVWQRLEEENSEFFNAYYVRLDLKKQIILFNQLLEKQYYLTNGKEYYNAMQHSFPNGLGHFPVDSSIGYPAQQPCFPYAGMTYMDPLYDGSLNYMVTGVPTAGNFYHNQHSVVAASNDQEMDTGLNTQFCVELDENLRLSDQSAPPIDAAFPSNFCYIDEFQFGIDGGGGNSSVTLRSHCNQTTNSFTCEDHTSFRIWSSLPDVPGPIADDLLDTISDIMAERADVYDIADFLNDGGPLPETQMQRDEENEKL